MARVPYCNFDIYADCKGRAGQFFSNPDYQQANIHKMLAHVGDAAVDFMQLVSTLRFQGELDPIVREIAIVRVGVRAKSYYELFYHEQMLIEMGVVPEKIKAIHKGPTSPDLSTFEANLLLFVDGIVEKFSPDDEPFEFLRSSLSERALHELVFNIGLYLMSCSYMETFQIDQDPQSHEMEELVRKIREDGEQQLSRALNN